MKYRLLSNTHSFILSNITMTELEMQAIEVLEIVEDSVEYICSENVISGEKVWTMVAALADAKLAQFPDN